MSPQDEYCNLSIYIYIPLCCFLEGFSVIGIYQFLGRAK